MQDWLRTMSAEGLSGGFDSMQIIGIFSKDICML
jgi:hypothetical protein